MTESRSTVASGWGEGMEVGARWGLKAMLIISIAVLISQIYTDVSIYQVVHLKICAVCCRSIIPLLKIIIKGKSFGTLDGETWIQRLTVFDNHINLD